MVISGSSHLKRSKEVPVPNVALTPKAALATAAAGYPLGMLCERLEHWVETERSSTSCKRTTATHHIYITAWNACPFGHLGHFKSPERPQAILSLWVWFQHKYILIKFEKHWYPLLPLKFMSSLLRKQISTSLCLHLSKRICPFLNSSNAEVWNRFTLSKGSNFCILFAVCTHSAIVNHAVHCAHTQPGLYCCSACTIWVFFSPLGLGVRGLCWPWQQKNSL